MSTTTIDTKGTTIETETKPATEAKESGGIVGTVLELGFAWAAYGLKLATTAVEQSSKTLGITAKALDKLADELAQKSGVEPGAAQAK